MEHGERDVLRVGQKATDRELQNRCPELHLHHQILYLVAWLVRVVHAQEAGVGTDGNFIATIRRVVEVAHRDAFFSTITEAARGAFPPDAGLHVGLRQGTSPPTRPRAVSVFL